MTFKKLKEFVSINGRLISACLLLATAIIFVISKSIEISPILLKSSNQSEMTPMKFYSANMSEPLHP